MTLALRSVSKTFNSVTVLHRVGFDLRRGEVRALVGQNGSGKSTIIKLLAGYHEPDAGSVATIDGTPFELGSSAAARASGLRFVHQDLALVLPMSVLDNMMLGLEYPRGLAGRIRWRDAAERVQHHLSRLGVQVDPRAAVASLTMAERTAVAIARVLAHTGDGDSDGMFIVLDEPTAALPQDEVGRLLEAIRALRADGHGVLLVSHHLNEVLDVADSVTVLRDGYVVADVTRAELDYSSLSELIVGHPVVVPESAQRGEADVDSGPSVLSAQGMRGGRVHEFDLDVHPGEIVGIAGITGSGREHVAPLLVGQLPHEGEIRVGSSSLRPGRPREAMCAGIASIPGERARYGVFANLNVRSNLTISDHRRHRRFARIEVGGERDEVQEWIDRLTIVTRGGEAPITSLSGGNQQKVLVARALRLDPDVLVLDDPTQGIDIGARAQIHAVIEKCAADGMALVLVSTDSDELARLSDRVLVLVGGRVGSTLHRGPDLTPTAIDAAQLDEPDTHEVVVARPLRRPLGQERPRP
jgi:ribose transport system ATP-binding protein